MSESATDYLKRTGVEFDWTAEGYHADSDGWEHHRFTVTFTAPSVHPSTSSESFKWRQGLGIEGEPDASTVLTSLVADAGYADESFGDFCYELGYDTDSRKARKAWKACRRVREQLVRLFGEVPDVYDD